MSVEVSDISCELISFIGSAKSSFIEALRLANRRKVTEAKAVFSEGEKDYVTAYESHSKLLGMFANGQDVKIDLLLVHAECSLMSAEDMKALAQDAIELAEEQET